MPRRGRAAEATEDTTLKQPVGRPDNGGSTAVEAEHHGYAVRVRQLP